MNNKNITTVQDRLNDVIKLSYNILCNKIAAGSIKVTNEASMQMQLGTILNQVGRLYEFKYSDHLTVAFDEPLTINPTVKSKNGNARCDIIVKLTDGSSTATAAIELKYLKGDGASVCTPVTNSRYAVLCDIQNLEQYKSIGTNMLCYEIVYTANPNYAKPNNCKFSLSDGGYINSYFGVPTYPAVPLTNSYLIDWDCYSSKHYFLKVDL